MRFLNLLLLILLSSCTAEPYTSGDYSYSLRLEDGKVVADVPYVNCIDISDMDEFKVLNLSDIQLGTNEPEYKFDFFESTLNDLVDITAPDMISITGDISFGEKDCLAYISSTIDACNVSWAPVFGNHDSEQKELNIKEQASLMMGYDNCLLEYGPSRIQYTGMHNSDDALGNYVVNLVDIDGDKFEVIRTLVFMNTGASRDYSNSEFKDESYYGVYSWTMISEKQKAWYTDMIQSAKRYNEDVKSSVFVHIPPFVYVEAASAAFNIDASIYNLDAWMDVARQTKFEDSYDPKYWREGYENSFGVMHETLGTPPHDDGFFDLVTELGSTDLIIAGHEHVNNFCIEYEGVKLVYGLKTGIGSYHEKDMLGGTLLTFNRDGQVHVEHILDIE